MKKGNFATWQSDGDAARQSRPLRYKESYTSGETGAKSANRATLHPNGLTTATTKRTSGVPVFGWRNKLTPILETTNNKSQTMSLSFVSKSVQTTTEDGGFVEEAIEGASNEKETTGVHKPLFEQLRANQEQEEAEREEYQKAIMRGTLALDEEDAAHLESLRRKESEQRAEVNRRTEEELAAFRAARADRSEGIIQEKEPALSSMNSDLVQQTREEPKVSSKPKLAAPQIRIKRKRRKEEGKNDDLDSADKKAKSSDKKAVRNSEEAQSSEKESKETALGSLLTGYGSSSDED